MKICEKSAKCDIADLATSYQENVRLSLIPIGVPLQRSGERHCLHSPLPPPPINESSTVEPRLHLGVL